MGWQPIATAPRNGTAVLLWLADEGFWVKGMWRDTPDPDEPEKMWWIPEMDIWQSDDGVHDITCWAVVSPPKDTST